jgi:hypothetical protein
MSNLLDALTKKHHSVQYTEDHELGKSHHIQLLLQLKILKVLAATNQINYHARLNNTLAF